MFGKPAGRVVAVLVLLILLAAALRGYLPAHHASRPEEVGGSRAAMMFLVVALSAALALVAFSIIARLRDPRTVAPSSADLSEMLGGGSARPSLRAVLIAVGVVVAWLLITILLSRLFAAPDVGLVAPQADSSATPAPSPSGGGQTPKPQPRHKATGDSLETLLAFVPVLLLLFAGGIFASRRRRPPASPRVESHSHVDSPLPETASESLVRAAEVGLAAMADLSREPREAIIACYAAMERELANVPGAIPQDADTPTEVLARAVEHHALHADNAVQLVNLFEEARFSPHVMNEGHRETAVRLLELVLGEIAPRSGSTA
jgi:hypothetical protein